MSFNFPRPMLGFVAYSGTGKTTLLEQLIPRLRGHGVRTALLKHAHHDFDIDKPGKDSYRLRQAGAAQVMVASHQRWALVTELDDARPEPSLAELLPQLDPERFDLLLVEGFKHESYPKVELQRRSLGKPALYPNDSSIIALACDEACPGVPLPVLNLNSPEQITDFILTWLAQQQG
jgi:molybdopterin-guanine dinucleotide biosynthesis protein MobB